MDKKNMRMAYLLQYYIKPFFGLNNSFVICPLCKLRISEFLPFGVIRRENAFCPKCHSSERHRLYYFYLKKILSKKEIINFLHVAPEKSLKKYLKSYKNINYLAVDKNFLAADRVEDLTNLSFKNNTFDIVFCSHVLEHVDDDNKAMQEVLRVLKPGAFAILQVPLSDLEKTLENKTITDPNIREKIFGQKDHLRKYGKDYKKRLEEAGFIVKLDKFSSTLSNKLIKKYSLIREDIYLCYKPEIMSDGLLEIKNDKMIKTIDNFYVITTFFNPNNSKNKLLNYNFFRKKLKEQGLKLITVECSFRQKKHRLTKEDADILIQVRSNSILWQRERLLNIALDNLPLDCDKIAWLDADIVILDDNWAHVVAKLLDKYHFVKPFSEAVRLTKKESKKIRNGKSLEKFGFFNSDDIHQYYSLTLKRQIVFFAVLGMCARREIFQHTYFYDKMILGSGDLIMTNAFINSNPKVEDIDISEYFSDALKHDINNWYKNIKKDRGNFNISFLDTKALHLFHGLTSNRNYKERQLMLKKYNYEPENDLKFNDDKCFEWGSDKHEFHNAVALYFKLRNEDNKLWFNLKPRVKRIYEAFKKSSKRKTKSLVVVIDRGIGIIGKNIKKVSPSVYRLLKKTIFKSKS